MTDTSLTLTSGALTLGYALSQPTIDAFAYSFTKAQRVARQTGASPETETYVRAMLEQLGHLGWSNVLGTVEFGAASASPGAPTSPLELAVGAARGLVSALPAFMLPAQLRLDMLPKVRDALESAPAPFKAGLDRWWGDCRIGASFQAMSMSTSAEIFGVPLLAGGYFDIAVQGASWRMLFDPSPDSRLRAYPTLLRLDMSIYDSIKDALVAELVDDVRHNIQHTRLDLD